LNHTEKEGKKSEKRIIIEALKGGDKARRETLIIRPSEHLEKEEVKRRSSLTI